jgi:biotin synthase
MSSNPRHDWQRAEVLALFSQPFADLLFVAQTVHRAHHSANRVQVSSLLSIKTGSCPENCKYCPQSAHYNTGLAKEPLMELQAVVTAAKQAKEAGASRFCMGAAWRELHDRDMPQVASMIREVKALGLETCVTLGMVRPDQASALKEAGLDYYNHNLDTSERFYPEIITTRTYQERLDTLGAVREAGISVCCGGIVGMGETLEDRADMLLTLANLPEHPESVPINRLIAIPGTPLAEAQALESFDLIRMIAVARIMMPASVVRLSAGREGLSDEAQALCFLAGANSIFYGETLLTAKNPAMERDQALLTQLGMVTMSASAEKEVA